LFSYSLALRRYLSPCFYDTLRASLGTLISHEIFIFPRENELISLGTMKIPWEISVPKLALRGSFCIVKGKAFETGGENFKI
jgi:hypothetical protein